MKPVPPETDNICVASRGRRTAPDGSVEQRLEVAPEPGKTNCLTTVAKDNLILQRARGRTINVLLDGEPCRIRRLTPTECARLQTVPTWYKWVVSETQQYRMLGNGWTVEVIKHIFSFLPETLKN